MFWICTVGVVRGRARRVRSRSSRGRRGSVDGDASVSSAGSVAVAGGVTVVALVALLFQSVVTGRALDTLRRPTRCAFR